MRILVLTKRQYMSKDIIDDRFGRFREIPLALAQKGHTVNGLCLSYAKKDEGQIKDESVFWKSINISRLKITGILRYIVESIKLAKDSEIIWACSDSFYGVIGCCLGRIYNIKVIFDIYDNFGEFFIAKLPIMKQLYHWAIRKSDSVTCLSKPFCQLIKETHHRRNRIYPIEFAVRTDLFKPLDKNQCRRILDLPQNDLLIGTAGGLHRHRDVHLLIEAFFRLKHKCPDMHLALAGRLDPKLSIPDDPRVHYLGILPYDKVSLFMNSLNIAVVCYANDNYGKYCFPQKTREFMACDIPLIAAKVGSLKELFKNHPNWLYEPGSVTSLAEVLEGRITDRSTSYPPPPTWADLANKVELIMSELQKEKKLFSP